MSLDPMPSRAELLAMARKRGALPQNATTEPRKGPHYPYRSKWESEYATRLEHLRIAGLIQSWHYEPIRLEIGVGARYKPDFGVITAAGLLEYHEVKGYQREAGMVRLRVAALKYPDVRFILVTKRNGQWHHMTIQ